MSSSSCTTRIVGRRSPPAMRCSVTSIGKAGKREDDSLIFSFVYSSAKKARLDENDNVDEANTDSASFEVQAAAKKKAAIRTVGTLTPVDDFKLLIEQGSPSLIDVCKQMCTLILELVNNSHGDALFEKAFQCLQCLRDTCIAKLEPKIFNDLEVMLKKQASTADGRRDFWTKIVDGTCSEAERKDAYRRCI